MSFGAIFQQPWFPPFAFCFAALAAWSLCFPILDQLRKRQLLDRPNERSSHTTPTPRGGGIAIVLVALAGLAILALQYSSPVFVALCGCIVALGGISFLDDIRELPARLRFGVQCVAAIAMLWA